MHLYETESKREMYLLQKWMFFSVWHHHHHHQFPLSLHYKKKTVFALCTVDLDGCLQAALIHLFPISPAASAGLQAAWEWKCLAHVIFGKCRVHRNPGAWSPVSARRPRLAIRLLSKDGGNTLRSVSKISSVEPVNRSRRGPHLFNAWIRLREFLSSCLHHDPWTQQEVLRPMCALRRGVTN